jgi:hypothetical protein
VAQSSANIDSPEVIRRLRAQFVKFQERCGIALAEIYADVRTVEAWLEREVHPYWRRQLRRRQDLVEKAKRDYAEAVWGSKNVGKASPVDEKKALDRAIRKKEEAELKLKRIKRWNQVMKREIGKRLQPCRRLGLEMDTLGPKALARLDQMMDSLDRYIRRAPPKTEG